MNLFKKIACITDIHFGRQLGSTIANQDCLNFLDWFIEEAKIWGADDVCFLGDWHESRYTLQILTMNASLTGMEKLSKAFKNVYWLIGNHDLPYRDRRDISSIEFVKHLPNIHIITSPITKNNVTFLPWLIGDEYKNLAQHTGRYVFGHLEIPGFLMNAKVEMPDGEHAIKREHFKHHEYVFSGHFHMRQINDNVIYMGNVMPFDFRDNWDEEKGMMLLEWGKEPIFKTWPDQPLYRTMKLSELLDNEKLLVPNLSARVLIDVDITYEEAQIIKDVFVKKYNMRRLELNQQPKHSNDDQTFIKDNVFHSIDQTVVEGLKNIQSKELKPDLLVSIFQGL